ncbi:hypothetical protein MXG19_002630 [Salmonella enterica]|nr:hypothetical protein [Salmonella enterica]EEU3908196.1 hypothetical protein [Salmonella enterica]EGY4579306.1 hypothetical protein [Salmonella enterica]EGY4583271.1 hypothetical protein [Salmonella enterica]EGY9844250.1 hypothetical protein [Salmonella enterica]
MNKIKKSNETSYISLISRISPAEVALAMLGFDCLDDDSILTKAQRKEFDKLKRAITRNLQIVETKPAFSTPYDSYKVLCAAFRLQNETTPIDVRNAINNAIIIMTQKEEEWVGILKDMGGDELYQTAKRLKYHKRGLHKREDEDRNDLKLMGLLVQLLQECGKAKYSGNITEIHRDLLKLCNDKKYQLTELKNLHFLIK